MSKISERTEVLVGRQWHEQAGRSYLWRLYAKRNNRYEYVVVALAPVEPFSQIFHFKVCEAPKVVTEMPATTDAWQFYDIPWSQIAPQARAMIREHLSSKAGCGFNHAPEKYPCQECWDVETAYEGQLNGGLLAVTKRMNS